MIFGYNFNIMGIFLIYFVILTIYSVTIFYRLRNSSLSHSIKELPFSCTAALLKHYQIAMFTLLASRPAFLPFPGYSSRHMGWLSDGMADIWVVQNRKAAHRYRRCGNRFCFLRQPHTAFRPEDPGSLRCRLEPRYRSCSQQDMLRYQPPRSNRQMVLS